MAEPFKNLINAQTVTHLGGQLAAVWPAFDRKRFEKLARTELESLELKARSMQLADALQATLPSDFAHACAMIEATLAAPKPFDDAGEPLAIASNLRSHETDPGISGWAIWPLGEFVARSGMHAVPRALTCLHALTQRFSAEFAIRPFIDAHPKPTFAVLTKWLNDPSAHVRRLVSEGSRPRLPWGLRLQALVVDPSPTLPLLRALQDDPSAYVRRSVANHLNDIAKDHPDVVAGWVREHLSDGDAARQALLRHASRSLIKLGHAPTLQAWGLGLGLRGEVQFALSAKRATVGTDIGLDATVTSTATKPQPLVVDYAVHHVRANGTTSPKVFKGWKFTLAPGETKVLSKRHSLKVVTTRKLYAGEHRIELLVNGQSCADASFMLR
ncbi:MAG: DNA alkylation repair protein [Kofleriaceae bacterium]|nr:DNA alkylation repair protein [Kofleriaceae bacterium]